LPLLPLHFPRCRPIIWSPVLTFLHVILLTPIIFRWLLEFW
jgi:hypothetical protein